MSISSTIAKDQLDLIHQGAIESPLTIDRVLARVRDEGILLHRGMNKDVLPETARLVEINRSALLVETSNFATTGRRQVFLRFTLDGDKYLLSASLASREDVSPISLARPVSIHREDRRDRSRDNVSGEIGISLVVDGDGYEVSGRLIDRGSRGIGVHVGGEIPVTEGVQVRVAGRYATAGVVRGIGPVLGGWRRLGIEFAVAGELLAVERRSSVLQRSRLRALADSARVVVGAAASRADRLLGRHRADLNVIEFCNEKGETLVGLLDGATAGPVDIGVIVPPAWGRTKETLLPLARTIVESFERQGITVAVLRFDGIRKRGESHCDPEFRGSHESQLGFTFSQGVRDLQAASDWFSEALSPAKIAVVSFSASSVEARRFVADNAGSVDGWISVVGTADVQSMMRVISGGVDYIGGVERGASFGIQEVLGLFVDIDRAARDALDESLAFLEDSLRDFASIECPIAWIRGEHDAWMDRDRVVRVLSAGDSSRRRLMEVPTGHQLRSSAEALGVFQLVAELVAEMVVGKPISAIPPSLVTLSAHRTAERGRLPDREKRNLRGFWTQYLLGADGGMGITLLNQTSSYKEMMERQVASLDLSCGSIVLDLGAGSGAFERFLADTEAGGGATVVAADLVSPALQVVRSIDGVDVLPAQLDMDAAPFLPFGDESVDACLCSLVVSYIRNPNEALREIRRILKPGGVLVLSAMKPDADISQIYQEGLVEIAEGRFDHIAGPQARESLVASAGTFLNDAARLMDLEEDGVFEFWSAAELEQAVAGAHLRIVSSTKTLGDPPQALLIAARRL